MSIQLTVPSKRELKPRIVVVGVGGAGGNAVNNMIAAGLDGAEFVVANTDAQALTLSKADRRIQMGTKLTEGLGAGSNPEIGRGAAEEALGDVIDILQGAHMAFITAGMGGGTGTGAAPVIARAARENGVLTVGVVTKPFEFEGSRRMAHAEAGIEALAREVDTLIIIPNQNLFRIANAQTTFGEAFALADEVLHSGVAGITDLMVRPGLMNLDFADVRTVMNEMGKAMMGTGEATGDNRAIDAAEAAISNPLLDDVSMNGARGILVNITGGQDMTLYDVESVANRIRQEVAKDANIKIGSSLDDNLNGRIRVSVFATGMDVVEADVEDEFEYDDGKIVSLERDVRLVETQEDVQVNPEVAPAPVKEASSLPAFMTERPATPPRREMPERSKSFIERVFGARKKDEAAAPSTPDASSFVETEVAAEKQEIETADGGLPVPVRVEQSEPAAALVPEIPAAANIDPVSKPSDSKEKLLPLDEDDIGLPEKPSRLRSGSEVAASAKPAASVHASAPRPAVTSTPVAAVAATSHQPAIQTTMQTPTMMASGFDGDQLDIPTFLRR
jgi:cell division protein FtsZ